MHDARNTAAGSVPASRDLVLANVRLEWALGFIFSTKLYLQTPSAEDLLDLEDHSERTVRAIQVKIHWEESG